MCNGHAMMMMMMMVLPSHIFLFCLHLLSSSLAFHRYFTFFNNQSSRQSSTFNTFHMEYWFWLLLLLLTNYHSLHTHTHTNTEFIRVCICICVWEIWFLFFSSQNVMLSSKIITNFELLHEIIKKNHEYEWTR